jgi:hypothetical protein
MEATFPERARTPVPIIEAADVGGAQRLHELRSSPWGIRGKQHVHVVVHQHIGVNPDGEPRRAVLEDSQVVATVCVVGEAVPPIVSPLHDVQGNTGRLEAWVSGHRAASNWLAARLGAHAV